MGAELNDVLDATGVEYEIFECDPELADTAEFCAAYGFSLDESANTIVVIGKSDPPVHAACIVLADTRLDVNKVVRKRLGVKKASFASGETTVELTGMEIGGVTPFGLPDRPPDLGRRPRHGTRTHRARWRRPEPQGARRPADSHRARRRSGRRAGETATSGLNRSMCPVRPAATLIP